MSIVALVDSVTDWARQNICSKIKLKVPPDGELEATDAGYKYQLANPAAFAMYIPTKEKLPQNILSPFPSVCVRILDGEDNLAGGNGKANVQLCFSAWNPGTHGEDVLMPVPGDSLRLVRWSGGKAEAYFRRTGDGWRDAWNLVDISLREIESVTNIGGYVVDRSVPVKFGPLTEQESIPDFYPFWFAWVSFAVTYPITWNIRGLEDLL